MKIYSFPTFNLSKILITAEELALDYEFELLNPAKGEHKSAAHMTRHPLGKVPALEYQGQYYFESNSICRLLAEESDNQLYSSSPAEKAVINQWIDLMALHIGRWMAVCFYEEAIKPNLPGGASNQEQIDEATGFLAQQLPIMEQALSEHRFLTGEDISIADCIAFAYCQTHEHSSVSFDKYPSIARWYQTIKDRPSVEKAMAQLPNRTIHPFGG